MLLLQNREAHEALRPATGAISCLVWGSQMHRVSTALPLRSTFDPATGSSRRLTPHLESPNVPRQIECGFSWLTPPSRDHGS